MYASALKDRIRALPNEKFVKTWTCIEAINEALGKAGEVAVLALTYVRVRHEEQLAQLLTMQESRIAHLTQASVEQHAQITQLATSRNAERGKVAKLEKKLARLVERTKKTSRR